KVTVFGIQSEQRVGAKLCGPVPRVVLGAVFRDQGVAADLLAGRVIATATLDPAQVPAAPDVFWPFDQTNPFTGSSEGCATENREQQRPGCPHPGGSGVLGHAGVRPV